MLWSISVVERPDRARTLPYAQRPQNSRPGTSVKVRNAASGKVAPETLPPSLPTIDLMRFLYSRKPPGLEPAAMTRSGCVCCALRRTGKPPAISPEASRSVAEVIPFPASGFSPDPGTQYGAASNAAHRILGLVVARQDAAGDANNMRFCLRIISRILLHRSPPRRRADTPRVRPPLSKVSRPRRNSGRRRDCAVRSARYVGCVRFSGISALGRSLIQAIGMADPTRWRSAHISSYPAAMAFDGPPLPPRCSLQSGSAAFGAADSRSMLARYSDPQADLVGVDLGRLGRMAAPGMGAGAIKLAVVEPSVWVWLSPLRCRRLRVAERACHRFA
jgi:hypothetical protein